MKNNLIIEVRKCLRRWDTYFVFSLFLIIPIFIIYNLSVDNSNIDITTSSNITFKDLYGILLGLLQHSGLLVILIIISSWNILGKEKDDGVFSSLFLFSKNRKNVYISKMLMLIFQYILYTIVMFVSYFTSFKLLKPKDISFKLDLSDITMYTIAFIVFLVLFLSLAFLGTILWGSLGILCSTGISFVCFKLLENYNGLEKYMPTYLLNINLDNDFSENFKNLAIVCIFIVIIIGIAIIKIKTSKFSD